MATPTFLPPSTMDLNLPADVLLLICEELGNRQDFGTLFTCAMSSRQLVGPALFWLYRQEFPEHLARFLFY
jgi:hypothetical protein